MTPSVLIGLRIRIEIVYDVLQELSIRDTNCALDICYDLGLFLRQSLLLVVLMRVCGRITQTLGYQVLSLLLA